MPKHFIAPTTYFLQEGRENMEECLKLAFQAAVQHDVEKILIFTAKGDGVKAAQELRQSHKDFSNRQLIAVTFPVGATFTDSTGNHFTVKIAEEDRVRFAEDGIPIVQAHLPFDRLSPGTRAVANQELALVGDALNIFCGSMSLCVQSVLLACDAGHVNPGEHVISLSADTAILVTAAPTKFLLSGMVVREILCKPVIMTIKHNEPVPVIPDETASPKQLAPSEPKKLKK